jgi:hypothetical protein
MTTFTLGHTATRSARSTPTHNVNHAVQEAEDHNQVYATTLAGDPTKLRGIPAIGKGVGGAIRGTQPHSAIR